MSAAAATQEAAARQAVLFEPGRLELRDFDPPHPGPGEILLEVKCALSCGTDLKTWRRGHPMWKLPTPLGHEFSGVVAEIGSGVTKFRVGDSMMAAPTAPCGNCFFCSHGQENLCPDAVGKMLLGAYADYLLIPSHIVAFYAFRKPESIDFDQAALLEPLSCVVHANDMARPQPAETVLIVGAGAFGLLHLLLLKSQNVRQVVIAGRREHRLKTAGKLGADQVIDVEHDDADEEISKLNDGHGPDLVIECTGQLEGWQNAIKWARRGGRVVLFGGCPAGTTVSLDTHRMHYDNLTLLGPFHYRSRDVRRAYELLEQNQLNAGRVIDERRRLSDLKEVFGLLENGSCLKCAVIP